jgi:hypothetical protein
VPWGHGDNRDAGAAEVRPPRYRARGLDQDTDPELLTITDETSGGIAFGGDRHQLPAVGRGGVLDHADRHEHRYLTHDQVDDLATTAGHPSDPSKHSSLDTRANETYRLVVLFLAHTGVRFGEVAALRVPGSTYAADAPSS